MYARLKSCPGSRKDGWRQRFAFMAGEKRIPNVALFEAFYNYCFVPKHTIGSQLLTVRRDKREREAYEASQTEDGEFDEDDAN